MNPKRAFLVALGTAALAVPAAAIAKPGDHGHGHAGGHGHGGNPTVKYLFKGTYGGSGVVAVNHGNRHARRADLVDQDVQFDLSGARLVVADTNADGSVTADDVATDDRVVVQARLPKQDPGAQPFAASRLVDQSSPPDAGD
jgi:hypothetical protein